MRGTLEKGGLKVVGDERSQSKYDGGACSQVQTILGLVYDCTDPTNPSTGLPERKQKELYDKLKVLSESNSRKVQKKEIESVGHKLSAASLAV